MYCDNVNISKSGILKRLGWENSFVFSIALNLVFAPSRSLRLISLLLILAIAFKSKSMIQSLQGTKYVTIIEVIFLSSILKATSYINDAIIDKQSSIN